MITISDSMNAAQNQQDENCIQILLERSRKLSQTEKQKEEKPSFQMLKFIITNLEYGVETNYIREVISNVSGHTAIPGVPSFVLGIKDIRGEIIPILDLLEILSIGKQDVERRNFCIVVQKGDIVFGIEADNVKGIENIEKDSINTDSSSISTTVARFCYGVAQDGSLLINGSSIFADTLIRNIHS